MHHFGGKEGLVIAVERLRSKSRRRLRGRGGGDDERSDLLRQRSAQTVRVMREHPEACAYLGRALAEGTDGSTHLFRLMIESGRAEIDTLAERSALRYNAVRLWATLQHFFLIWAPLSFMPLLEQEALDGPILEEKILDRGASANVGLLREGLYR